MKVYKKAVPQVSVWQQIKGIYEGALIFSKVGIATGVLLLLIYCASNDTYPRGVGLGDVLSFVLVSSCFGLVCGVFGGLLIYSGGVLIGLIAKIPLAQKKWPKNIKVPSPKDWWMAIPMFMFAMLFEVLTIALTASNLPQALLWFLYAQILSIVLHLFCGFLLSDTPVNFSSTNALSRIDKRISGALLFALALMTAVNSFTVFKNGILNLTMRLANIRQDTNSIEIYLDAQIAKDMQLDSPNQDLAGSGLSKVKVSGIVLFGKIGSYTTIQVPQRSKQYQLPLSEIDANSLAIVIKDPASQKKILVKKAYIDKRADGLAYQNSVEEGANEKGLVEIHDIHFLSICDGVLTFQPAPNYIVVEIPNEKIIVAKKVLPQS